MLCSLFLTPIAFPPLIPFVNHFHKVSECKRVLTNAWSTKDRNFQWLDESGVQMEASQMENLCNRRYYSFCLGHKKASNVLTGLLSIEQVLFIQSIFLVLNHHNHSALIWEQNYKENGVNDWDRNLFFKRGTSIFMTWLLGPAEVLTIFREIKKAS